MKFLLTAFALFLVAALSLAGDSCRYASGAPVLLQQQVYQTQVTTYTQAAPVPVLAPPVCTYASSAQAFVPSYAPAYIPQERIVLKRQVYAAPVYAQQQIGYGGYGSAAFFSRQRQFAPQDVYVPSRGVRSFQGGPGAGLFGFVEQAVSTADRVIGGNGDGSAVRGAALGVLLTRNNIFGLGNGGRGGR